MQIQFCVYFFIIYHEDTTMSLKVIWNKFLNECMPVVSVSYLSLFPLVLEINLFLILSVLNMTAILYFYLIFGYIFHFIRIHS